MSRPTSRAPIESSGWTRGRWPRAGSGRRAAAPSSPGSSSARARASGRSISARRRAGRRPSSRARSTRSRSTPAARGSSRRTRPVSAPRTCSVVCADALRASAGAPRLRPRARRRSLLGPWRACLASRPALAGGAAAWAAARALRAAARSACGQEGQSSTPSARSTRDENEAVVDASGLDAGAARRGMAAVRPSEAPGVLADAA